MPLPNVDEAVVDPAKVRDYLLSSAHQVGRFKAVFFSGLGFTRDRWDLLRDALLAHARSGDAHAGQPSLHGRKIEVHGTLQGPAGAAKVIAVWILRAGERGPRFVTAFPG